MRDEGRGLTVEVIDQDGMPLKEYDGQKLGSARSDSENVTLTTNIEAVDDRSFTVRITPHVPFPILAAKDPEKKNKNKRSNKKKTRSLTDTTGSLSQPIASVRDAYN